MGFAAQGFVGDSNIADEEKQLANKALRLCMSKIAANGSDVVVPHFMQMQIDACPNRDSDTKPLRGERMLFS